jgi:hypothetical protein
MKLGFDNRWLLPPPLHENLSSVGCSRAGVGRPSLRVRARVCSLSLLSLSSRNLTQEAAACGFRRVFGALRRGGQPQPDSQSNKEGAEKRQLHRSYLVSI